MNSANRFSNAPDFAAFVRYIADSQKFAPTKDKLSKLVGKYSYRLGTELSEDELDMVTAATKIPIPEFVCEKFE